MTVEFDAAVEIRVDLQRIMVPDRCVEDVGEIEICRCNVRLLRGYESWGYPDDRRTWTAGPGLLDSDCRPWIAGPGLLDSDCRPWSNTP